MTLYGFTSYCSRQEDDGSHTMLPEDFLLVASVVNALFTSMGGALGETLMTLVVIGACLLVTAHVKSKRKLPICIGNYIT